MKKLTVLLTWLGCALTLVWNATQPAAAQRPSEELIRGQGSSSTAATVAPDDTGTTDTTASADDGTKCEPPNFKVQGWRDPNTLILTGSADPARHFAVGVALTKDPTMSLAGTVPCAVPADPGFEYILCNPDVELAPASGSQQGTQLVVSFTTETFWRMATKDGTIQVRYLNKGGCDIHGWVDISAYDRSLVRMEGGVSNRLDGAGNWKANGEAAVRFTTRWLPHFSGGVEVRYTGIAKTDDSEEMNPDGEDTVKAAAADMGGDEEKFNPFAASDGVLRADFTLGYHIGSQEKLPTLTQTVVGGFGLTTLRGTSGLPSDATDVRRRLFAGFRLSVPRYHVDGIDELTAPKGFIQFAVARDELWKTTIPATDDTAAIKFDKRNRFVVDGTFEFLQIGQDKDEKKTTTPVAVRLLWDAPINLNGASEVRVSILTAFNFFRH